jgi:hypothetical protein
MGEDFTSLPRKLSRFEVSLPAHVNLGGFAARSGRCASDEFRCNLLMRQQNEWNSKTPNGGAMSDVVYVSKARIERKQGPIRIAHLPGEAQPVIFSVHSAIAEHYKMDPAKLTESHSSTIDYVIAATAG